MKDLLKAFPDIEIDELRLSTAAGPSFNAFSLFDWYTDLNYIGDLWKTKPARRRTLEKLAGRMGFNPIILKNWLNPEVIDQVWHTHILLYLLYLYLFILVFFNIGSYCNLLFQVSPLLSRFYNNNMVHAVHDLFPETYRGKPV